MRFMGERFSLALVDEVLEANHLEVVQVSELKRWLDRSDLADAGVKEPQPAFVSHNGELVRHFAGA